LDDEKASKYAARGNRVNGQYLHIVRKMRQRGKHEAGRTKEGGHPKQTLFITKITTDDSLALLAADKESLHIGSRRRNNQGRRQKSLNDPGTLYPGILKNPRHWK
jgi:hypothetical protein